MPQPVVPVLAYNFQSELGSTFGTHLDANFNTLVVSTTEIIDKLGLIQRDDGWLRSQTVHANTFTSDALALMAGSSVVSDLDWRPLGFWATATTYEPGNIIEEGSPATAYVCAVLHVSGTFATDYLAGYWVVLSAPRTLTSADIVTALTYTPVNKAGDTMTGPLVAPTLTSIAGVTFYDTLIGAQDLVTINKGIYVNYESVKNDNLFGFAANVVRGGASTGFTVGAQCSGIALSGVTGSVFGANFNALGLSGHAAPLIGMEIDVASFDPDSTQTKMGLYLLFADRAAANPGEYSYVMPSGTYASSGGGLGGNLYNYAAWAINLDSQATSGTGEFCGWTRGMYFSEYSLGRENNSAYPSSVAFPIGIDFSNLHYYGGTDPVTSFNLEAAVAMRDFQTIWWNRDPASAATATNKIKTYFNPATGRWVIYNGSVERFGIDVTLGTIYLNGVALSSPSLVANNTWSGTNTFNNQVTIGGSLAFTGNARRITGDFSNPTVPNRVIVQTSSANDTTEFGVMPSGSGGVSAFYMLGSSAAANCAVGRISVDSAAFQLAAGILGAAANIPMTFGTAGSERMRIDQTIGQVIVNATAVTNTAAKLRVNGLIQIDNPAAFSVHRNGVAQTIADSTTTAIDFTTEVFDTGSYYSTVTDRFTPPAGYYNLMGGVLSAATACAIVCTVYKNGAVEKSGNVALAGTAVPIGSNVSCVVSANGTDYFQLFVTQVSGAPMNISGLATDTYFQGHRIG